MTAALLLRRRAGFGSPPPVPAGRGPAADMIIQVEQRDVAERTAR